MFLRAVWGGSVAFGESYPPARHSRYERILSTGGGLD
jgi:hypothetical protein